MTSKTKIRVAGTFAALLFAGVAVAGQGPVVNIGDKFPNLREAQEHIVAAYNKLDQAQAANHNELGGHAAKAKEYLSKADAEIREAANTAKAEGH